MIEYVAVFGACCGQAQGALTQLHCVLGSSGVPTKLSTLAHKESSELLEKWHSLFRHRILQNNTTSYLFSLFDVNNWDIALLLGQVFYLVFFMKVKGRIELGQQMLKTQEFEWSKIICFFSFSNNCFKICFYVLYKNTDYRNFVKHQNLEMPEGLHILLSIFNFSHTLDYGTYRMY